MEDPKLSILETSKTLKVNRGGDGSPSCKRIRFYDFYQSHHSHIEIYMNYVTTIVNTQRYSSNYSTL